MTPSSIPTTSHRTTLSHSVKTFLHSHPKLYLGGDEDFHNERRHHLEVFGFYNLPDDKQPPVGKVEFTATRGPHGTIPLRLFYPSSSIGKSADGQAGEYRPALIYFHGGGYTVGSVDEFENGLRILAVEADMIVRAPVSCGSISLSSTTKTRARMLLQSPLRRHNW